MWAKWYTVGPQVYISTWPGVWVLNSSFRWVAELYRYMAFSPSMVNFRSANKKPLMPWGMRGDVSRFHSRLSLEGL